MSFPTAAEPLEVGTRRSEVELPYGGSDLLDLKPKPLVADATDARHSIIEKKIKTLYEKKVGITCSWDGAEGKHLKSLLQANPSWTTEQLSGMVDNLFASEDGKYRDRPRMWLAHLSRYACGPLDRYGKPCVSVQSTTTASPTTTQPPVPQRNLCDLAEAKRRELASRGECTRNALIEFSQIKATLKSRVPPAEFERWIAPLWPGCRSKTTIIGFAPSAAHANQVIDQYSPLMCEVAAPLGFDVVKIIGLEAQA